MNDEEFENLMSRWKGPLASQLQARDTAQREALAQMKIERDQYDELHLESITLAARHEQALARVEEKVRQLKKVVVSQADQRSELMEQLSEAVILIGQVQDCRSFDDVKVISRFLAEFLARHARRW